ncbi:MAG: hypothetical protein E7042_09000 [Lentisphaerae bacterium]|nr:hypothetical protein [Lentisphaerota bacterium]
MSDNKRDLRNLNNDLFRALDECAEALSLAELSRISGVKMELLRRYLDRKVRVVRAGTWDKVYPVLKPYLEGPEPVQEPPPRIGKPYRRHPELVEMFSAQKVLLDEFAIFSDSDKKAIIAEFTAVAGKSEPTSYESLSNIENQLMGCFLAMDSATQDEQLSKLTVRATAEVRKRRSNLF